MKKMYFIFITTFFLITLKIIYPQGPEWIRYSRLFFPFQVEAIVIDSSGYKWIGTYDNGLVRFDGNNWIIFKNELLGWNVRTIAIDLNENIWIGTFSAGIYKLTAENMDWNI